MPRLKYWGVLVQRSMSLLDTRLSTVKAEGTLEYNHIGLALAVPAYNDCGAS